MSAIAEQSCTWSIRDGVEMTIEELSNDQFRLAMRHEMNPGELDAIVSVVVGRGELQAFAKLLQSFLD